MSIHRYKSRKLSHAHKNLFQWNEFKHVVKLGRRETVWPLFSELSFFHFIEKIKCNNINQHLQNKGIKLFQVSRIELRNMSGLFWLRWKIPTDQMRLHPKIPIDIHEINKKNGVFCIWKSARNKKMSKEITTMS